MPTSLKLTPEAIDRIIEDHFQREADGDVEGTLATFTDDVVHDVVGDSGGELHGPAAVGIRYEHLFRNVQGERFDVKHRLYGDNFVVDDKVWTARVVGEFMGIPGNGRAISVRVLHVFEFRDGRISRENVWLDAGAAIAQLQERPRDRCAESARSAPLVRSTVTWPPPRRNRLGAGGLGRVASRHSGMVRRNLLGDL